MNNHVSLPQLASQAPGVINQVEKRNPTQPVDFDQYFDYKRFYGEETAADPESRSRSDSASIPGLTSGPSEEDGAPSPGPSVDPFDLKLAVKQFKQHDDRFTVPAREIRPNGAEPYPPEMEIDNTPGPNTCVPDTKALVGNNMLSSSNGVSIPAHVPTLGDSPLNRGRRTKPLANPDKVAHVRQMGACSRCRAHKTTCDEQVPCARCKLDAAKYCKDDDGLAAHICSRRPFCGSNFVFHMIWRAGSDHSPAASRNNTQGYPLTWTVYFDPCPAGVIPLEVSVLRVDGHNFKQYILNRDRVPENARLFQWAESKMARDEGLNLQTALDNLTMNCAQMGKSFLPHYDIVRKVHELRCMYKIWRQRKFFCQKDPGGNLEELPDSIHKSLKGIAAFRIKALEPDILTLLEKHCKTDNKPPERLPLWTSMLQLILMYRDVFTLNKSEGLREDLEQVQRDATNLFKNLVVICESCFSKKKKPEAIIEDGAPSVNAAAKKQLNVYLKMVETRRDEFYQVIEGCTSRQYPCELDYFLHVLLVEPKKGQTRAGTRANKRPRRL
ncbi:hypothetical protein F4779DRAFT_617933 [Xylariaceae sp. FL0662B]|nr:hypothetical protein F4779DRAFT_617933 [Xylariaceae sp. FL0662B]